MHAFIHSRARHMKMRPAWVTHCKNIILKTPTTWIGAPDEDIDAMLTLFVTASSEQRQASGMCACPPLLRIMWQLGQARAAREASRRERRRASEDVAQELEMGVH